jgi:prepilin-type N-terminal cleavage/methylation domain-containing protein
MKNDHGFTLIEMLVTMALVVVVLAITSSAFNSIVKSTSRLASSEESNIEGVVGLEMFRHDLQQIGYGLPDSYTNYDPLIMYYTEATVAPANLLNDNTTVSLDIPRAVVSFDNLSGASDSGSESGTKYNVLSRTDYIGIKATSVGRSKASQKWTYVTYSTTPGKTPYSWPNAEDNFKSTDRAIVISRSFSAVGGVSNTMILPATSPQNIYWPSNPTTVMTPFSLYHPSDSNHVNYIYGVDDSVVGMPFNRADYFVARPSKTAKIPSTCAPNTGILYRTNINHADGKLTYMPLLDCVADMQVVFGWEDPLGSGAISESAANGAFTPTAVATWMADPKEIRERLKYVKVYIMAQEGRKDSNYTNINTLGTGSIYAVVVGEPGPVPASNVSLTKAYTAADLAGKGWLNYRWKTYRIVVRPKNLTN